MISGKEFLPLQDRPGKIDEVWILNITFSNNFDTK